MEFYIDSTRHAVVHFVSKANLLKICSQSILYANFSKEHYQLHRAHWIAEGSKWYLMLNEHVLLRNSNFVQHLMKMTAK